jgi:hypothetical protein
MSQTGGRSTGRQKQAFKNRRRLVSPERFRGRDDRAVEIDCVNIWVSFARFERFRFALLAES